MKQDLRFAFRMLFKNPAFTLVAVFTLALGIGANTSIFSVVDAVLLRPLPYSEAGRLVQLWGTDARRGRTTMPFSYPDFLEIRRQNRSFDQVTAYFYRSANFTGGAEPERIRGVAVSPELFAMLGVRPQIGRTFSTDEGSWGNHHVALLSHGLWRRAFGGRKDVQGQTVSLNGIPHTVAGVMPSGFGFPIAGVDVWTPIAYASGDIMATRNNYYLRIVARRKEGIPLTRANADLTSIAGRLAAEFTENAGLGFNALDFRDNQVSKLRPALWTLLGAVSLVLLIACANVANLLLARGTTRRREVLVKTALGASRYRLVRQSLIESLLLGLCGGLAGLLIAYWAIDLIRAVAPQDIPRVATMTVDLRAVLFTFAISLVTTLFFGLAPALANPRANISEALKDAGRGSTESTRRGRLRSGLIVAEVALSLVLAVGAGLLIQSFRNLIDVDPGFSASNVATAHIALPESRYEGEQKSLEFFRGLLDRVRGMPGIVSAGVGTSAPLCSPGSWGN